MQRLMIAALAAVLLLAGLASTSTRVSAQSPTPTAPPLAACPTAVTMTAAPAAAGSSVVAVTLTPSILIKAAAAADPQSFHVHYYVDTDASALKPGDVIPAGNPAIVHSGHQPEPEPPGWSAPRHRGVGSVEPRRMRRRHRQGSRCDRGAERGCRRAGDARCPEDRQRRPRERHQQHGRPGPAGGCGRSAGRSSDRWPHAVVSGSVTREPAIGFQAEGEARASPSAISHHRRSGRGGG